jgi:hypothetical protein
MSMSGHDLAASTAENYRGFAAEARDGHNSVPVRNGGTPLAVAGGHGTWLDWLG